jgi:hypothetical protein
VTCGQTRKDRRDIGYGERSRPSGYRAGVRLSGSLTFESLGRPSSVCHEPKWGSGVGWRYCFLQNKANPLLYKSKTICNVKSEEEPKGLMAKCAAALKLWREYQSVMQAAPVDKRTQSRWRRQIETEDRQVRTMLEAALRGSDRLKFDSN